MHKNKGFTLVELLVVIAIIGLLATIAFISLNSARGKARDAKRISDVRSLQSALELYYNDQATPEYPDGLDDLTNGDYIAALPTPPLPNDGAVCLDSAAVSPSPQDEDEYPYTAYETTATDGVPGGTAGNAVGTVTDCGGETCGAYTMTTCIGGATGGLTAGIVYALPTGISNTSPL